MKLRVDTKSLKNEIGKLNKSGLIAEKIDLKGKTEELVERFCDSVDEAVGKDQEKLKKLRSVVELYNDLVKQTETTNGKADGDATVDNGKQKAASEGEEKFNETAKQEIVANGNGNGKSKKRLRKNETVSGKVVDKKKKAGKKIEKKDKTSGPGVIVSILEFIQTAKRGITKDQILEKLVERFPERTGKTMIKTVNAQIGGKKSPTRMESERKVKFLVKDGKYSIKD